MSAVIILALAAVLSAIPLFSRNRLAAVFALALCGTTPALAEESPGWIYAPPDSPVVAEAGFAWVKPTNYKTSPVLWDCSGESNNSCSAMTGGQDATYDAAWGVNLAGRYRLSPFAAVEIGYTRTLTKGDAKNKSLRFECFTGPERCFDSQGNLTSNIIADNGISAEWTASIFHAGLRLEYDAGFLSAFVRGGMNLYTVDYDIALSGGTVSADDEGGDPYYGLGAQVGPVAGGWTRHGAKLNDTDIFHLSYNHAF